MVHLPSRLGARPHSPAARRLPRQLFKPALAAPCPHFAIVRRSIRNSCMCLPSLFLFLSLSHMRACAGTDAAGTSTGARRRHRRRRRRRYGLRRKRGPRLQNGLETSIALHLQATTAGLLDACTRGGQSETCSYEFLMHSDIMKVSTPSVLLERVCKLRADMVFNRISHMGFFGPVFFSHVRSP